MFCTRFMFLMASFDSSARARVDCIDYAESVRFVSPGLRSYLGLRPIDIIDPGRVGPCLPVEPLQGSPALGVMDLGCASATLG